MILVNNLLIFQNVFVHILDLSYTSLSQDTYNLERKIKLDSLEEVLAYKVESSRYSAIINNIHKIFNYKNFEYFFTYGGGLLLHEIYNLIHFINTTGEIEEGRLVFQKIMFDFYTSANCSMEEFVTRGVNDKGFETLLCYTKFGEDLKNSIEFQDMKKNINSDIQNLLNRI